MTTALMYHELRRPDRPLADSHPGYTRYALDVARFVEHTAWMASAGLRGVSVGDAYRSNFASPNQVAITFDDGCASDWLDAAPRLRECGFGATFYVVANWIGRRAGFMSTSQLRQLSDAGFEIGSHSASHAFLTDLDDAALRNELRDSRRQIEDTVGRPVVHVSCPGGRVNRRVSDEARDAGYETMATSRVGVNDSRTDPFELARCPILRDTPQHTFEAFCRGDRLVGVQMRARARDAAKALLGNRLYSSLRSAVLR